MGNDNIKSYDGGDEEDCDKCLNELENQNIQNKKDFHRWSLKNHPDKGGSLEKYQEISNCNDIFYGNNPKCNKEESLKRKATSKIPARTGFTTHQRNEDFKKQKAEYYKQKQAEEDMRKQAEKQRMREEAVRKREQEIRKEAERTKKMRENTKRKENEYMGNDKKEAERIRKENELRRKYFGGGEDEERREARRMKKNIEKNFVKKMKNSLLISFVRKKIKKDAEKKKSELKGKEMKNI